MHSMSWITVIWSMVASACLTLALIHLVIWFKQKEHPAYLLFAVLASAVAGMAAFELALMRAETPRQFGEIMRWGHPVVLVLVYSVVGFVQLRFRTGRVWLAYTVCGSRGLITVINFLVEPNVNYRQITALRHLTMPWGETITAAEGVPSPWAGVVFLSVLLTIAFIVDASLTLWRRGGSDNRRRATSLGGSFTFFALVAAGSASLNHAGLVHVPYLVSLPFLVVLFAMAYELSLDVLRSAQLVRRLEISQAELRESEECLHLAASAAGLGLWVWDIVHDEVWSTDTGRALFGIPPSVPLDFARFLNALAEEDRGPVRQAVARALNGGGDYEGEYRVLLPDGGTHWIAARGRVEFDELGKPLRMRGVSIDVTRRMQAELEVQSQRTELAHLSRVTMLGELSGSLAHELNQPLAAILSNAQAAQRFLKQEGADRHELKEILGDIVEEDKRASEVIRRLRLLLKKGEVQSLPVDMNEVVADVLKLMRSDLVNQGVMVETKPAAGLPQVRGDKVQLQQVLLNLMVNACDAMAGMPAAERRLRILTVATETGTVQVSVCDRGRGVPAEILQRIFDPFMTTKPQGMGLGLAVCRTIISAHGGRLWVANEPDGGAGFHFTLPAFRGETV